MLNKYYELIPRSHIGAAYFGKINWLTVSERVESCTATTVLKYWNGIIVSCIKDLFKPSFNRYNTRSQMTLDIHPYEKQIHDSKLYLFLDRKYKRK